MQGKHSSFRKIITYFRRS